jgi:hypothetical protein
MGKAFQRFSARTHEAMMEEATRVASNDRRSTSSTGQQVRFPVQWRSAAGVGGRQRRAAISWPASLLAAIPAAADWAWFWTEAVRAQRG